jgi:hypothetical protein
MLGCLDCWAIIVLEVILFYVSLYFNEYQSIRGRSILPVCCPRVRVHAHIRACG